MFSERRTNLICIIGVDGTGKTAHAVQLMDDLKREGYKCKYVWFGSPYLLSYPFMVLARFLGLTKMHYLPNNQTYSEHLYFKNKPVALMWKWIQFVDICTLSLLEVLLPTWAGYTVICDRYVYDAVVGLMDDLKDYRFFERIIGRAIFRLKPKSSLVFLLNVNDNTAFGRKGDIPDLQYVTRRKKSFKLIAKQENIPIIDANQSFATVQTQLAGFIRRTSIAN